MPHKLISNPVSIPLVPFISAMKKEDHVSKMNPKPQAISATSFLFVIKEMINHKFTNANKIIASIK
jgi:hypothetical protein